MKAAVIGAGQGGLHLGLGLLGQGWEVTMLSDKTPEQVRALGALQGHTLQARSLDFEREVGACLSDEIEHRPSRGLDFALSPDGVEPVMRVTAQWPREAVAIDLRLKYSLLMERFAERGGRLVQATATADDLDELAASHDVVFLATGKGELRSLFPIDETRTVYDRPQRHVMLLLLDGIEAERPEQEEMVNFLIRPGVGEVFFSPILHKSKRPVYTCLMEAVPGGPLDVFDQVDSPEEGLAAAKRLFEEQLQWEAKTIANSQLADPKAMLKGAVTPGVRRPVAHLESGRFVAAVGDITMVHDPAAGLGGNTTACAVDALLAAIAELEGAPIEADWVEAEFDRFWEVEGQWFARLSNTVIEPLGEAPQAILGAGAGSPAVANAIADSWAYPARFFPAFESVDEAQKFIAAAEAGAATQAVG